MHCNAFQIKFCIQKLDDLLLVIDSFYVVRFNTLFRPFIIGNRSRIRDMAVRGLWLSKGERPTQAELVRPFRRLLPSFHF